MGEANRRGTFAQRQAEGIEKRRLEEEKQEAERVAYWNSLTEEEKEQINKNRLLLASMMAMANSGFRRFK